MFRLRILIKCTSYIVYYTHTHTHTMLFAYAPQIEGAHTKHFVGLYAIYLARILMLPTMYPNASECVCSARFCCCLRSYVVGLFPVAVCRAAAATIVVVVAAYRATLDHLLMDFAGCSCAIGQPFASLCARCLCETNVFVYGRFVLTIRCNHLDFFGFIFFFWSVGRFRSVRVCVCLVNRFFFG